MELEFDQLSSSKIGTYHSRLRQFFPSNCIDTAQDDLWGRNLLLHMQQKVAVVARAPSLRIRRSPFAKHPTSSNQPKKNGAWQALPARRTIANPVAKLT
jgi:hypothetical protein